MRPLPLLLAAALVTASLAAPLTAVDAQESPATTAGVAPAAAATPGGEVTTTAAAPETTPAPAETTSVPTTAAATEPAGTVPAASPEPAGAATPPAPQVITAHIDPELALRLSLIEKTMLAQSEGQSAIYSETTRLLMFFGTACVAMGLIAMVAAVFLMNRTLASVSAITAQVAHTPSTPIQALPGASALVPAPGGQPGGFEKVQASGQRFQSRMTSLEQRLEELEHLAEHGNSAAPQATEPLSSDTASEPTAPKEVSAPKRVIPISAILVRKSETLLSLGKLDEAMAALDEAEKHDGDPAEIHLARGRVLEKQGRLGDALQSYDLAVNTDQTSTAALLMKAGVLNRQERFDEALSCYERALAVHRANN